MRLGVRLRNWIARTHWAITKPVTIGVRLLLVDKQRVLLVKHAYGQHWYLPGGGVQRGETLQEAARREGGEEVGAKLGRLRLFGVYSNFYEGKSDHVLVFSCDDFTLSSKKSAEIEDVAFFSFSNLPPNLSPGTRRRLTEYLDGVGLPVLGLW